MEKNKCKTNEKAITLIALIITIVIMLILVGVSIQVVIESNLIGIAQDAGERTELAYEQEAGISQVTIDGKTYTSLEEYKKQSMCNHPEYVSGKCTECGAQEQPTSSTIVNSTVKSNYYGATVTGLTLNNGDTSTIWKIFYVDQNNIYLIASECINATQYVSSDLVNYGDTQQKAYFTKTIALPAYDGGATETAIFGEGTVGGTLLKTYLDHLETSNLTKNNDNMKAVAFMLDTTAWSGYTDSNQTTKYIDYAIGGPTLEMFVASYGAYYNKTLYTPLGDTGYYIGDVANATTGSYLIGESAAVYIPSTLGTNTDSYWLASPSANRNSRLNTVTADGNIYRSDSYYQHTGFRPVIRLNKNVKLTPTGSSTYSIGY